MTCGHRDAPVRSGAEGPATRPRLLFAIAHVLDARHDYARAAYCLREANALTLETRRAEGVIYEPDDHEEFVERLIKVFDRDFFVRSGGLGLETRRAGLHHRSSPLRDDARGTNPRQPPPGARRGGKALRPKIIRKGAICRRCR